MRLNLLKLINQSKLSSNSKKYLFYKLDSLVEVDFISKRKINEWEIIGRNEQKEKY